MQTVQTPTAEVSIEVDASPVEVWGVVSDVTRIPEWSPVCHRVEWVGDVEAPEVGARFVGSNKLNGARWSRECVVTAAEPNRTFAFSTLFRGAESTRWIYRIEPVEERTQITEAYEVVSLPTWVRIFRAIPGAAAKSDRDTRWNLSTSLERLKAIVESR